MKRGVAADGLEGALPATAGATACPPETLCCSLAGNGFGGVSFEGARGIFFSLLRS